MANLSKLVLPVKNQSTGVVTNQEFNLPSGGGGSSDEIADIVNILTAKNLFQNKATSMTESGVTFTVNKDGTITANGTYTVQSPFLLSDGWYDTDVEWIKALEGEQVIISGGVQNVTFTIKFMDSAGNEILDLNTGYGGGTRTGIIPSGVAQYSAFLYPNSLATLSNAIFKPMIRPASIQDDTYEPYAKTNKEITPYIQAISNPNLLDNPWFTVNQRGQSTYNSIGYTVDRWYNNNALAKLIVASDGIIYDGSENSVWSQLSHFFETNEFEHLLGKTITLSLLLSDGTIISNTGAVPSSRPSSNQNIIEINVNNEWYLNLRYEGNRYRVFLTTKATKVTAKIRAVKLELGSVSTLAQDIAPKYAIELAKCKTSTADPNDTYANKGQIADSSSVEAKMDKANPTGTGSFSLNRKSDTTVGNYSFAEGYNTTASGQYSHAAGDRATASGQGSYAEGWLTTSSNNYSHAEGSHTTASGVYAHAEGGSTTASKVAAHAEGSNTIADGDCSHAEGEKTTASGKYSHAGGRGGTAYRPYSFVQGGDVYDKFNYVMPQNGTARFGFAPDFTNYSTDTYIGNGECGCSGCISGTATVEIQLQPAGMYLLLCAAFTASTGAGYGSTTRMITAVGTEAGTPANISLGQTSTAPATIAMAEYERITIKNTAAARVTEFHLIRIL